MGAIRCFVLAALVGCAARLPEGWEDARPVASLVQTECGGSPYEAFDERVEVDLASDPLVVEAFETHFRCAQDVEGFVREEGDAVEVLVQPIDMTPKVVAGCDCLYDLVIEVGARPDDLARVSVYRRWDDLNDANDPVLIGEVE
ncbi:MAG: hypothetical protein KDA28_15925 [Phycisphaerales bacterium]|nr:hypothetical protein [Phycisphaerales bacterium]